MILPLGSPEELTSQVTHTSTMPSTLPATMSSGLPHQDFGRADIDTSTPFSPSMSVESFFAMVKEMITDSINSIKKHLLNLG